MCRVPAGSRPGHIYLHPSCHEVWVTNDGSADVTLLGAGSGEPLALIPCGSGHHKVAFAADGERALVTNIQETSVTLVDGTPLLSEQVAPVVGPPAP